MSDPVAELIASLHRDGKELSAILKKAQEERNKDIEKQKQFHSNVKELISQILNELDTPVPSSFPEKIIPNVLEKLNATLHKFKEINPATASDYDELLQWVKERNKSKQKTDFTMGSSSTSQQTESRTTNSASSAVPNLDDLMNLDDVQKKCLFCFFLFPAEMQVKKKEPLHLWAGMDLIVDPIDGAKTLDTLVEKNFIERTVANNRKLNRYKIKEQVRSIVKQVMRIEFFDDPQLSIMRQIQKEKQAEASPQQQPQQEQPPLPQQQQQQQTPLQPQPAPAKNLMRRMSSIAKPPVTKKTHDDGSNVSGALVLNIKEHNLRATTFERLSKKKDNVKVLLLGNWSHDSKTYIVIEDDEATFKAMVGHVEQATVLSLQGISGIVELPESISKLDNYLKVLDLRGCPNLESLSNGIGSLKRLTHLDLSECYLLEHIPQSIDSLTELRVLKGFVINPDDQQIGVGKHKGKRNRIRKKALPSASFSKLTTLTKLIKLTVRTRRTNFPTVHDFQTLNAMESLRNLKITWVLTSNEVAAPTGSGKFPKTLEKLELQATPDDTMLQLLKLISDDTEISLKNLYIRGGNFCDLGNELYNFSHVQKVRLRHLPELHIDWVEFSNYFPNLNRLEVMGCPNLLFFPCDVNGGVWDD